MKKFLPGFTVMMLVMFCVAVYVVADDKEEDKPKYVGLGSCKACHSNAAIGGIEYLQFEDDPHRNAFETLKNEKSKEIAAEMGIGDPTKDGRCLKCHVTAYDLKDRHGSRFSYEEGVTCEACHGPGEKYLPMPIMKDREKALAAGMIIPDAKLCKTCHNPESPTYREFDFDKHWKLIEHGKDLDENDE